MSEETVPWQIVNRVVRAAVCRDQLWLRSFLCHCRDEHDCHHSVSCLRKTCPEKFNMRPADTGRRRRAKE